MNSSIDDRKFFNRDALSKLNAMNKAFKVFGVAEVKVEWVPCTGLNCTHEALAHIKLCDECLLQQKIHEEFRERLRENVQRIRDAQIPARWEWSDSHALKSTDRIKIKNRDVDYWEPLLTEQRLVFMGASGAGKTSLGCCLLKWFIQVHRKRALFVPCFELPAMGLNRRNGYEVSLIEDAKKVPLVLLDEFGGEDNPPWNPLIEIIHARYNADLPIWVTTGMDEAGIRSRYGEQIYGRIFEGAKRIRLGT